LANLCNVNQLVIIINSFLCYKTRRCLDPGFSLVSITSAYVKSFIVVKVLLSCCWLFYQVMWLCSMPEWPIMHWVVHLAIFTISCLNFSQCMV